MEAADLLRQTPFFAELSEADISALAQSTRLEIYRPGHVILRQGRIGAAFYVLVSGTVEVVKEMAGAEPLVVGKLGAGDFFGEISTMKHVTRSASVRALSEATCVVIRRLDLDSFLERYPVIAADVASALSARFDKSVDP